MNNYHKEAEREPCPSCPFLVNNHEEFRAVARRVCEKHGRPEPDFWACLSIRKNVVDDAIHSGRLQCHATVYDRDMAEHPEGSLPCAGLARYLTENKGEK